MPTHSVRRSAAWPAVPLSGIFLAVSSLAIAAPPPPTPDFTAALREGGDVWRNVNGGLKVGYTNLNKLQLSATWTANRFDDPGFRLHGQVLRTTGERLTSHTGDLQAASDIEEISTHRLFEAWAEQIFGEPGKGGWAVRAGLIDLNSDFDAIEPASLFINSSHGIGPELSKSGRNGPSIFPVSSAAFRLTWTPTEQWTFRGGVFDGVPGDLEHAKAFAQTRLRSSDGVLAIGDSRSQRRQG
jgi:porin